MHSPLQEKWNPVLLYSMLHIRVLGNFMIICFISIKSVLNQSPQKKKWNIFSIIIFTDIFINALEICCSDIQIFLLLFCQKVIAGLQKRTEHTRTMLHIMHNVENCQAFIKYVYHFLMWFICLVFRLLHGKVYFVHILFILLIYYKPYLNDPCTFFMLSYSQWPLCM